VRRLRRFGLYWEHHVCPAAVDYGLLRACLLYGAPLLCVRSTCPALVAHFERLDRIRPLGKSTVDEMGRVSARVG
jgi:hypothetical protein